MLARQAAEDVNDPTALGVAAWAAVVEMLTSGAFELARVELDSVTVPTNTNEGLQLDGMLALSRALVAAADKRPRTCRRLLSTPCRLPSALAKAMRFGWASVQST
jgi:hypothetical protein